MGYRGWHGVTDPKHILLAVCYEPIDGTLACRFNTGDPVMHINVPEVKYEILLKSPFAGSYYRKHIKPKYPYLPGTEPKRGVKVAENVEAIRAKREMLDAQRVAEAHVTPNEFQWSLF